MAAGSIIIDLLMRTGAFETDTKRAEKALKDLQASAARMGAVVGASVAAATVATVTLFDHLVKGASEYQDLAEMTGTSAEALASYAVAAGTAGVSMGSVADAMNKLTKGLTGVDDESKAAGAALGALGLEVEDFKKLDPAEQYEAISKAMAGFEDGAGKAAVAQALFGKAGVEQLKVFKALEEQGGRTKILTQEQIELADAYADQQAKLTTELSLYAQAAATQALPAVNDLIGAFTDVFKDMVGVDKATGQLAKNNGIQEFADKAANALAFVADAVQGVVVIFSRTGEFIGFAGAAMAATVRGEFEGLKGIIAEYNASLDNSQFKSVRGALDDRRAKREQEERAAATFVGPPASAAAKGKSPLKFDGVNKPKKGGAGDDPTKKILDNRLKELERDVKREQDLMSDRNEFLELYNNQGLLSIKSYYDAQRTIIEANTSAKIEAYNKEIAALEEYQRKAKKPAEKEATKGRIEDVAAKRAEAEQEAGKKSLVLNIKQVEAEERLKQEIKAVSAEVLELQGNLAAAAAIRFDQQNLDLVRRLTAEGNTEALKMLASLREMTIAQAKFSQETKKTGQITESLHNDEERIGIARQLGAITELESLKQLGERRQDALKQMEAHVKAQEAIAEASKNPELIQNPERARLELEKLAAVADPLADKFRGIFQGSFSNAFEGFINGSMNAKDALRSFASSVSKELMHITADNLAEQIFGKEGPLGGLGDLLGSAMTGGKSAAKSAKPTVDTSAITRSLTTLQATGVDPTTSALARLAQAADGAAGSLGGQGTGDGSSSDLPWESGYPEGSDGSGVWESGFPSSTSGGSGPADVWESDFPTFGTSSADQSSVGMDATADKSLADFGRTATDATFSILKLADAAGKGGGSMEQLPQLLQGLFSSLTGAMGGSGGSGGGGSSGGGFWGTIMKAAVSYFGGAKAGGGDVIAGRSYLVGEMGPERFVPRTTGTILNTQQISRQADQRPIQITQQFAPGTSRATVDQAAAQAGAAVRRATARTR